jgi:hypothetical protein
MPRFVILEHDHPLLHWDFMLEAGNVLRTWRLEALPAPGRTVRAEALGDHRKLYLDYEGPVSGNRGHVTRWDAGDFTWHLDEGDRLAVILHGQRCRGTAMLARSEAGEWSLVLRDFGERGA